MRILNLEISRQYGHGKGTHIYGCQPILEIRIFRLKSALSQLICTPLNIANCQEGSPDQIGNRCNLTKPQPGMAILTILPTFVCCIFTASYWRIVEVGTRQKFWTLPFVLLQLYLPFSEIRFAYRLFKNDERVIDAKKYYDITMSTLGMSP